ncbi:MAG TPA: hypothetical protein VH351_11115 [Bryobacteraceae bacterium]|nr:hypothetical protein [Bryobacteraceae bacterium]
MQSLSKPDIQIITGAVSSLIQNRSSLSCSIALARFCSVSPHGSILTFRPLKAGLSRALVLIPLSLSFSLYSQQGADEARESARNPVADVIKVPFVEDIFVDTGRYGRTANSLQIQPVIPVQISGNFLLVPRIVATPLAYVPDVTQAKGGTTGVADTILTFFITPVRTGKLIWGVGPALLIPTSTSADVGGGRWDLGPSFVLLTEPKWGSAGLLVQNIWSLPGNSRRVSVDQIQIETSFSANLPHGWYLLTAPTISADWIQAAGNRWVVPFGAGTGRVFDFGHQAMDFNIALYYNAIRPARLPFAKWQLSLQLTLLYPKKRKPTS